ncbi:peptidase A4 family-domain-containing protein [Xylariaceae sp. FL0255]|nr:peptidase A4 family-domain-containing protein [Xylariaceae sp. FL0255]
MKFPIIASVSTVLLASTTLAAPGTCRNRNAGILEPNNEYTENWAGAVLVGTGYTTVSGTIVVPEPTVPPGGSNSGKYSAAAWVGIDGSTCQTAILQTGIDMNLEAGAVSYTTWYEWYPDYSYDFTGFGISAGDTVAMSVATTSKTSGTVTIENHTTGQTVSHDFENQSGQLCQTNAEWIVEDFQQGNSLVPFVDFNSVTFTDAMVDGQADLTGATIYDIKQGDTVLTSCKTVSSTSVTCSYAG